MAQGGIYVFEADTEAFANRKRAARACPACQKRKKKCSHTFSHAPDQQAEKDTVEKVLPQLSHKEPIKFVGDLNPESVLTDLATRQKDSPRFSRVGIWVEQSRLEREQFNRQAAKAAQQDGGTEGNPLARKQSTALQRYSKVERGRRTLTGHQRNYLQAVGALRVLPKATQDALVATYVACIDPLLPIIDCGKLLKEYSAGEASVFLIQAICLVACKTEDAASVLRLYEDGPLMDPIPFARSLHTGLDAAMKADLEADRFTKVQILTLMSLHNDGPGGIEESSLHLVMAIHDAQTNGLHINTPGRTPNDQAAMIWWTLWTLDKFNACLGGRPLMIAERDVDIGKPNIEKTARSQVMAVWLAMGDLLDKVIEFYRPIADPDAAGWEKEFPTFEELTDHCNLDYIPPAHQNLLELCYNIIGILACRAGGPASKSYNRRIASADRIQQLTAEGRHKELPPLPLVPYAISLSLTVAYRGLRDQNGDLSKTQSDLSVRCTILESVNKIWWTADAMGKLGRKALKSLQQPPPPGDVEQRKPTAGLGAIGDALEAEVSVCKYAPFEGFKQEDPHGLKSKLGMGAYTGGGKRGVNPAAVPGGTNYNTTDGNALHLLSDAAARHGQPAQNQSFNNMSPTLTSRSANALSPDITMNNMESNKRQRLNNGNNSNGTHHRHANSFTSSPFLQNHGQPQASPGSMSTPALSPHATSLPTLSHPTPNSMVQLPNSSHSMNNNRSGSGSNSRNRFEINPAIDPFCATTATYSPPAPADNPLDPNVTGPPPNEGGVYEMDYAFNDLDNLFEGFFDLSMPTMFQDPIYEGAAYDFNFNSMYGGGPGSAGAGSMDFAAGGNGTDSFGFPVGQGQQQQQQQDQQQGGG